MKAMSRKGDLYFEALLYQLAEQTKTPRSVSGDWREVFDILTYHIKTNRHYVVFDEFPWMASGRSELVFLTRPAIPLRPAIARPVP